ncbi:MAG: hypothetical protein EOO43_02370 [Flavobacterium sp.]|nr:MAG: hypothetical protein EOO43_02370 [Flavobacterium sp.]
MNNNNNKISREQKIAALKALAVGDVIAAKAIMLQKSLFKSFTTHDIKNTVEYEGKEYSFAEWQEMYKRIGDSCSFMIHRHIVHTREGAKRGSPSFKN